MKTKPITRPWQNKPQHTSYGHKYTNDPRYHTKEWREDRKAYLDMYPLCVECEKENKIERATVCDHKVPVKKGGDFWDWTNRQGLCKHHNAIKTAKDK